MSTQGEFSSDDSDIEVQVESQARRFDDHRDEKRGEKRATHFTYAEKDDWDHQFEYYCGGRRQSPINLDWDNSSYRSFSKVQFGHYSKTPQSWIAINNGHSAQFTPVKRSSLRPYIKGGGLGLLNKFYLEQFHFHWGSDNTKGSEHQLYSVSYPMEVHFVHRSAWYKNFAAAVQHRGGVAVVAVMFEVSTTDNPKLAPVIEALENLVHTGDQTTLAMDLPFDALLPDARDHYYVYDGSLTTPTCNEVVNWVVYTTPVNASEAQLNKFRALKDSHNAPLVDNYRDPQPLNSRKVYRNFGRGM